MNRRTKEESDRLSELEQVAALVGRQHCLARLEVLRKFSNSKMQSRKRRGPWHSYANYLLGGLATIGTAAAGVSLLTDTLLPLTGAGILLVGSAVLTALVSFYDFEGRVVRVGIERAEWRRLLNRTMSLQNRAAARTRDALGHEAPVIPDDELQVRVDELWDEACSLERGDAEARARS